jgi:hypothetical protein
MLPFVPSVSTTTVLFSLTSRSLRPLHRTTTLMLVDSPPSSASNSRSLRFVPVVAVVAADDTDSAGDIAPLRSSRDAVDACRAKEDLTCRTGGLTLARDTPDRWCDPIVEVILRSMAEDIASQRRECECTGSRWQRLCFSCTGGSCPNWSAPELVVAWLIILGCGCGSPWVVVAELLGNRFR